MYQSISVHRSSKIKVGTQVTYRSAAFGNSPNYIILLIDVIASLTKVQLVLLESQLISEKKYIFILSLLD